MDIDWASLFTPSGSVIEVVIRGSIIYLTLFVVLRVLPRRTLSEASTSDILIVVLIADAVQNGMAGEYKSVTEALVLAGTLVGWAVAIDGLDHRFPQWYLTGGKALPLIEDGRFVEVNMKRQLITEEEMMSQLRLHGLESPHGVRRGYIEGDGSFSFLLQGGAPVKRRPEKRTS